MAISAAIMWRDETGVGWSTWRQAAHADATRYFYALLNAVIEDSDVALRASNELAKAIYVNGEAQMVEPWGKLYAISETQPAYDKDGNEIKPYMHQDMQTMPAALRKMREELEAKPRGVWSVLAGGRK